MARRALLDETAKFLSGGLTGEFKQQIDQPWYALAAGLFLEGHASYAKTLNPNLLALSKEARWIQTRAAAAIGLGLSSSKQSRVFLRKKLGDEKSPMVRGYLAEALGLLGDKLAIEQCQELAFESKSEFLRFQGVTALAAMGDFKMVPRLMQALGKSKSATVRVGLTRAISHIGDRRTLAGLFELANDPKKSQDCRIRAITAMGVVTRLEASPWVLPIRQSINPTAMTPTLVLIANLL